MKAKIVSSVFVVVLLTTLYFLSCACHKTVWGLASLIVLAGFGVCLIGYGITKWLWG